MRIFCDDGSTNVKLAWFEGKTLKSAVSVNSFRHNWKVEGLGSSRTYNYLLDGRKYTYDPVSEDAISTTHIEYQYSDTNVLAVHHALLNSGIEPQEIDLTVTLPISEFYTADCQKNTLNIERKIRNLMREVGNPDIGVSMVTKATLTALKMASSDTSPMIADELIKNRNNLDFVGQVVNEVSKLNLVLDTIDTAINKLGELVVDDLL
ncbi:plasmid segregation protein ParM domain-containing protein, partial [Shigella sonnei]|uniref:plasmid segregation protein ParM domain-containing protein n=1 Tax=Shigella sonnei TaxID=624 RepID=UPI001C0A75C4